MDKKNCPHCGNMLTLDNFYKRKNGKPRSWCKECNKIHAKRFYKKYPEYNKNKSKKWYAENKQKMKDYKKRNRFRIYITESSRKYGITKEDILKILEPMVCEICGKGLDVNSKNKNFKPNIDHCHNTGKVRGLLCGYCNNLLGRANDSINILKLAIKYLERF